MVTGHERVMKSLLARPAVELHHRLQHKAKVGTTGEIHQHVELCFANSSSVSKSFVVRCAPAPMDCGSRAQVEEAYEAPAPGVHYKIIG